MKEKINNFLRKLRKCLENIKLILEVALLVVLVFTFKKCSQEILMEKRKTAISEISKIKDRDFLDGQARLKLIANMSTGNKDSNCVILNWIYNSEDCNRAKMDFFSDINYIFNIYENIGTLYENKLVEEEILEAMVCEEIIEFDSVYHILKPFYFSNQELPDTNYWSLHCNCIHFKLNQKNNNYD